MTIWAFCDEWVRRTCTALYRRYIAGYSDTISGNMSYLIRRGGTRDGTARLNIRQLRFSRSFAGDDNVREAIHRAGISDSSFNNPDVGSCWEFSDTTKPALAHQLSDSDRDAIF